MGRQYVGATFSSARPVAKSIVRRRFVRCGTARKGSIDELVAATPSYGVSRPCRPEAAAGRVISASAVRDAASGMGSDGGGQCCGFPRRGARGKHDRGVSERCLDCPALRLYCRKGMA